MVENGQASKSTPNVPKVPFARRAGSSFGVEVVSLRDLYSRDLDHSIFWAHRVEFHILLVVSGGKGRHMVDFVHYPIERGVVVHVSPGQVNCYERGSELTGYLVLFEAVVQGTAASRAGWPASFQPEANDFELLESLAQLMFDLKSRELSIPPDRVVWRLMSAVLDLCEGAAKRSLHLQGTVRSAEFEAFDALLEDEFDQHRSLSWYANRLGYSERTLTRWCQRAVGRNAKAHIDGRVVLEAKRLLVHTDHSVESIAARLNFSESTNFVKFFKRLEGGTPSRFRNSYKRME